MASWETLPLEIIIDILVRLSVRKLIRLQIVSKQLYAIIKSQSFVKLHHSYKVANHRLSLLAFRSQDGTTCVFSKGKGTWLHFPSECSGRCHCIECICNGLVLSIRRPHVRSYHPDFLPLLITLWNPATRKSEKLPLPNFLGIDFLSYKDLKFGFGYDHKANDFKMVQFRRFVTIDVDNANVYSFNTGAPWKRLKNSIPIGKYKEDHVHINGVLFWRGSNNSDGDFILSFNFGSEVFTKVAMPISPLLNNNNLEGPKSLKLGVHEDDSLALILAIGTSTLQDVVVWVMKKDCNNSEDRTNCWMKIIHGLSVISVPSDSFHIRDVTYGKCNKCRIIRSSIIFRKKKLYLSDTYESRKKKKIGKKNYYYMTNYVKSLFPVSKHEI